MDSEGRRVRLYVKFEVYLVEVKVSARPSLATVRLRGALARFDDGTISALGLEVERGFFDSPRPVK